MKNVNKLYVSKKEVKPYRKLFHEWMQCIREQIADDGISFTYMLVGSAKRNLVIRNHNKGFDCDYQIKITKNTNNINAKKIKFLFINALNSIVGKDGFKKCNDSTSAITIKKTGDNSNIEFSYDVVILRKCDGETEILRNLKKTGDENDYRFELLPNMTNSKNNFNKINGNEMWNMLRNIYYEKKMEEIENHKTGKKSFQILNEAVNEVLVKFN